MASIGKNYKSKDGSYSYILNLTVHGSRFKIGIGRGFSPAERRRVERDVTDIEERLNAGLNISPDRMRQLPKLVRDRLSKLRFFNGAVPRSMGDLWDRYVTSQEQKVKETTLHTYQSARNRFFQFFDEDIDPEAITIEDGEQWRSWLRKQHYSEATVACSIQRARAVFNWALKNHYVGENIFLHVERGSFQNKNREFYIPLDWYRNMLDACPNQEWRTLLALCRIGGLRHPSETLRLTWGDINWEKNRLLIHSSKTEHHEGKESRVIPIYPELRPELENSFDLADESSPYVLAPFVDRFPNYAKTFRKIIVQAGYNPWARLFHNLRGSRSNDLFSLVPAHVAAQWMGQGERIAYQHYLHPTDDQFDKAANNSTEALLTGILPPESRNLAVSQPPQNW